MPHAGMTSTAAQPGEEATGCAQTELIVYRTTKKQSQCSGPNLGVMNRPEKWSTNRVLAELALDAAASPTDRAADSSDPFSEMSSCSASAGAFVAAVGVTVGSAMA